jgi:Leucine-rich repeat (LRR) protein
MKNAIIAVLVVAVAVLGYFLYDQNSTDSDDNSNTTSQNSSNNSESQTISDGETINLSNRGLSEVPKDILDDPSVKKLDVSGNNLTGALPAEIRMLSNLEILDASDNNLTGIPAEIGQLSKLTSADFSNNDISGLPLEIGNLSNLETLDLRGNPNVSEYDLGLIQPKIPNANILTD